MTNDLKPIRTLNSTKGGILQAISGHKTINLGYDNPPKGLVYLTNDSDPTIRVPVVIESVKSNVPFDGITEKEARDAGYSSKERMGSRLMRSATATTGREGSNSNAEHALEWLKNQSRWSLVTFRLATPEELKAAGADVTEANKTLHQSVASIFANRDETVERALHKLGVGENAYAISLERAIDKQFAAERSVA